MAKEQTKRGCMVVISGPSGSGKSTICRRLLEDPRTVFSVSATTRPKRPGEVDGKHYHFLTDAEFDERVAAGDFIEHKLVHGNRYGTLREPLEEALAQGDIYLVEIDVQGGAELRRQLEGIDQEGVYIFIEPPNMDVLRKRLEGRGTDSPEVVERRLKRAIEEMEEKDAYNHVIVNDDFEAALARVRQIVGLDI